MSLPEQPRPSDLQDKFNRAVEEEDFDTIRSIFEIEDSGVDFDVSSSSGITALMIAVKAGNLDVVKALLEEGADLYIETDEDMDVFAMAEKSGATEILECLYKEEILRAVESGDFYEIEEILAKEVDVNVRNKRKEIALIFAIKEGELEIVNELLVEKGIGINYQDEDGWTALMFATSKGYLKVVKALIEKGVDCNLQNDNNDDVLEIARRKRERSEDRQEIFEILDYESKRVDQGMIRSKIGAYLAIRNEATIKELNALGKSKEFIARRRKEDERFIKQFESGYCAGISTLWAYSKWLHTRPKTYYLPTDDPDVMPEKVAIKSEDWLGSLEKIIVSVWDNMEGEGRIDELKELLELPDKKVESKLSKLRGLDELKNVVKNKDELKSFILLGEYIKSDRVQRSISLNDLKRVPRDDNDWFVNITERISSWDPETETLTKKDEQEFELFISYIQYFQKIPKKFLLEDQAMMQGDFDKILDDTIGSKFDEEYSIGSLFDQSQLGQLLSMEGVIQDKKMICILSPSHATALFKDGDDYFYFDPNSYGGQIRRTSLDRIAKLIFKANFFDPSKFSPLIIKIFSTLPEKERLDYPSQQEVLRKINPNTTFVEMSYARGHNALMAAVESGSLEAVKYFLTERKMDPNLGSENGRTALMKAAERESFEIVKALLESGADVNIRDEYGRAAAYVVRTEGHKEIADYLYKIGKGYTALMFAAEKGDIAEISEILAKAADINETNKKGWTALMISVKAGNLEVVRMLVDRGADFDSDNLIAIAREYNVTDIRNYLYERKNYTSLMIEVEEENLEKVEEILRHGEVEINAQNVDGKTALDLAAEQKNYNIAKALLMVGANVDTRDKGYDGFMKDYLNDWSNYTDLMVAVLEGYYSEVKRLLGSGFDPDVKNGYSETALMLAVYLRDFRMIKTLLKGGADPVVTRRHKTDVFRIARRLSDYDVLDYLRDWGNYTNLMIAVEDEDIREIKYFLKKGVGVDEINGYGETALMLAAEKGNLEIVKILLEAGADIKLKNNSKRTARDIARRNKKRWVARYLKALGEGNTMLMLAVKEGNIDEVRELLAKGVAINVQNRDDETALMLAAEKGNLEIFKALLAEGANRKSTNSSNETVEDIARKSADRKIIGYLDDLEKDNTMLILAIKAGNIYEVKELIAKGFDVSARDEDGKTALMLAVEEASSDEMLEIVKALLAAKEEIDVDARDGSGYTALMIAAKNGNLVATKKLIHGGADPNIQTDDRHNALKIAKVSGSERRVIEYLKKVSIDIRQDVLKRKFRLYLEDKNRLVRKRIRALGSGEDFIAEQRMEARSSIKKFKEAFSDGIPALWMYSKWLQNQPVDYEVAIQGISNWANKAHVEPDEEDEIKKIIDRYRESRDSLRGDPDLINNAIDEIASWADKKDLRENDMEILKNIILNYPEPRNDYFWFMSIAKRISKYSQKTSLTKKEKDEIDRFISKVQLFQSFSQNLSGGTEGRHTVFGDGKEEGKFKREHSIGSLFTLEQLQRLLDENFIRDNRMLYIKTPGYITALVKEGGEYCYFTPDSYNGEVKRGSLETIAGIIFSANYFDPEKPSPLAIEIFCREEEANVDYKLPQEFLSEIEPELTSEESYDGAYGATALMMAVEAQSLKSVRYFLEERHAEPNVVDDYGWTALMFAAEKGNAELVKKLLENGADPNFGNSKASKVAEDKGYLDLARYLVDFERDQKDVEQEVEVEVEESSVEEDISRPSLGGGF